MSLNRRDHVSQFKFLLLPKVSILLRLSKVISWHIGPQDCSQAPTTLESLLNTTPWTHTPSSHLVMLRCPPSRISLTTADVYDLDTHLHARPAARVALFNQLHARLSPGPGHRPQHTFVSRSDNVAGGRRPVSCSSQTTVCSTEADDAVPSAGLPVTFVSDSSGAWAVDTPSHVQKQHLQQTQVAAEAATALEKVARQRQPSRASPSSRCVTEHSPGSPLTPAEHTLRFAGSTLDGVLDIRPTASPPHHCGYGPEVDPSRRGIPVLGNLPEQISSPPRPEPRALDSARARRRNVRTQDSSVHEDAPELQHLTKARHVQRLPGNSFQPGVPPPVPELVVPAECETDDLRNPALDPGAPVFVSSALPLLNGKARLTTSADPTRTSRHRTAIVNRNERLNPLGQSRHHQKRIKPPSALVLRAQLRASSPPAH